MTAVDPRFQQIRAKLHIYQEIAQHDYDVPPRQALPVASQPDIAFRPSCNQLEPVWEPGSSTAWVWQREILYQTAGESLATDEIFADLAAAGVCLIGSNIQDIPLVPTDEVFPKFQQAVSASAANDQAAQPAAGFAIALQNQWALFVWATLPLLAIGALMAFLGHRSSLKG